MTDQPVDPRPPSRSGMMPLDGSPWPPRTPADPSSPSSPGLWGTVERRPEGSDVVDWRSMPLVGAPDGYQGSATAPPLPARRWDRWSLAALCAAAAAWLAVVSAAQLAVPLGVLALGFGLAGRRATSADPTRRGGFLALAGIVAGAAATAWMIADAVGWFG